MTQIGVGPPVQVQAARAGAAGSGAAVAPSWAADLDAISWAQVRFGLPSSDAATPLYPGRPANMPVLKRIAQWLRAATPAKGEISTPSRDPYLHMRLRDGRAVVVRLAHNCVTEKLADSIRRTCSQAEGQVIVHPPAGDPVRLQAPELAAWLRGGWQDGEGGGTCCPPSNGTRLAVVPVMLGGFSWEGEIPGNGPFSLTVQAEGGGAHGIRVERAAAPGM